MISFESIQQYLSFCVFILSDTERNVLLVGHHSEDSVQWYSRATRYVISIENVSF